MLPLAMLGLALVERGLLVGRAWAEPLLHLVSCCGLEALECSLDQRASRASSHIAFFGPSVPLPPQALQNWWLSVWSNATAASEAAAAAQPGGGAGSADDVATGFYLGVYFAFGLTSLALQGGRAVLLVAGTVNAARELQARLSHGAAWRSTAQHALAWPACGLF